MCSPCLKTRDSHLQQAVWYTIRASKGARKGGYGQFSAFPSNPLSVMPHPVHAYGIHLLALSPSGMCSFTCSTSQPSCSTLMSPYNTTPRHSPFNVKRDNVRIPMLTMQAGEMEEDVWQAALGAWMQLTTHGGMLVEAWLRHVPPAALAHLARACIAYGWWVLGSLAFGYVVVRKC